MVRKLIAASLIIVFSTLCFADGIEEATQSLDTAKSLLAEKNYSKAIEEINYALNKVNEVLAEKLNGCLPEAPKGYLKNEESTKGNNMGALFGMQGALMASTEYNEDKPEPESNDETGYVEDTRSKITVSIAVGGILGKAGAFASFGQMAGGDTNSKSIRIKGYTGTVTYNKTDKRGTIVLQLGEKVSITTEGTNLANTDILKSIIESMKLNELEKGF